MTASTSGGKSTAALTVYPKAAAAGLGGAVSVVVIYCLTAIWGIVPPAEVTAAITAIVSFACSYLAPRSA